MDWDNARGADATARAQIEALFTALYRDLSANRASEVATQLDLVAYFELTTGSLFTTTTRPLAIVHRAAHNMEAGPTSGAVPRAGGPVSARSNERGSSSFDVAPVSEYLSPSDFHFQATRGGRAYLKLRDGNASTAPCVR